MDLECKRVNNFSINNRKAVLLCGFVVFILLFFVLMSLIAKSSDDNSESKKNISAEETNNLINQKRKEIEQTQNKIEKYRAEIKLKQKKRRTLEREMSIYQSRINKNKLEVKETKLAIEATDLEIEDIKASITEGEKRIEKDKGVLKNMIKTLYTYEESSMLEILMTKSNVSDFFNEVNATESVKDKVFKTIINLKTEKKELELRRKKLEKQQEEQSQLIEMRYQQNESLSELKVQKKQILEETEGEEKKFQQIFEENKQILPSLRAQLMNLQSLGKKIKFDDAFSAAKYVGSVTGVRPAYLLAILRKESSMGTNIGGGTYQVDMPPRQRASFKAITVELGYDPNKMPVSKKPKSYRGWGGAMGPAQMMPTTWLIYQNEISEITGNYPPDPWDLTDALAAIAAKVSKVPGVTEGDYNAEYKAAGLYFAGRNWRKFLFYPDRVMLYADLFEQKLGI